MKKITLSVALLASVLALKAQDTTCTYFKGKNVYEFNYQNDSIIGVDTQTTKFYTIEVKYGSILCLDLSDGKKRFRKVVTTFFDGETATEVLDSENDIYFSPQGTVKVSVSKPRLFSKI
jgi:hypothetical protein|tara:strand:+ start:115 stop:471 length:357 start_codon:yes stop_codon:yes gene_type:complete